MTARLSAERHCWVEVGVHEGDGKVAAHDAHDVIIPFQITKRILAHRSLPSARWSAVCPHSIMRGKRSFCCVQRGARSACRMLQFGCPFCLSGVVTWLLIGVFAPFSGCGGSSAASGVCFACVPGLRASRTSYRPTSLRRRSKNSLAAGERVRWRFAAMHASSVRAGSTGRNARPRAFCASTRPSMQNA